MCLLLESIKVVNRKFVNLHLHQARVDRSLAELGIGEEKISLTEMLGILEDLSDGVYKCRVIYGREIQKVEFIPYGPAPLTTLKLVHDDKIDYHLKFADRRCISSLMELRGGCDDILIVKNGFITDTSYCNILFFDGSHWLTPDTPLLSGTQRQHLLELGKVNAAGIRVEDLRYFQHFMVVNAMLDFDEQRALPLGNIVL